MQELAVYLLAALGNKVSPMHIILYEMSDLKIITGQRKQHRSAVTRMHTSRADFESYESLERLKTRNKLQSLRDQLSVLDEKYISNKFSASDVGFEDELVAIDDYGDKIIECMSILDQVDSQAVGVPQVAGANATVTGPRSLLKRPTAPLPEFKSTPGENLELFLDQFDECMKIERYTENDKLVLLKKQVTGRAALLLKSLGKNGTYTSAKEILMTALASKDIQKHNVLKQMSEMKLPYNGEPFEYISEIRVVQQAFDSLNILVEDVMQYFFLNGMNDAFRNQLTLIAQNIRPSVDQINEHFFTATERFEVNKKHGKSKQTSHEADSTAYAVSTGKTNAASSENPFYSCPLCGGDNKHPIHKCRAYPNSADKIARLKELRRCMKCSNLHHEDKCAFNFKSKCRWCSDIKHFSFLCPNAKNRDHDNANYVPIGKPQGQKTPKPHGKETVCSIVSSSFFQENLEVDSALSTFSVNLNNGSAGRGLFDSASQSSFVLEKSLANMEYETLKPDVNLTIRGINESKTVKSRLIRAKLKIGVHSRTVDLLTVPSIDLELKLPQLGSVVDRFNNANLVLADQTLNALSTRLDKFVLLLGANNAHVFEGKLIKFGERSAYMETPFGIMLIGSLRAMLEDFSHMAAEHVYDADTVVNLVTHVNAIGLGFLMESPNIARENVLDSGEYEIVVQDLDDTSLLKCNEEVLDKTCTYHLNKDNFPSEETCELNAKCINYLLDNFSFNKDNRPMMPLLWKPKVKHLLSQNYNLAKNVLVSNRKKFAKDPEKLHLIDENIRDLEKEGVVEKIHDLDEFMKLNPSCSFLAHNSIFKPNNETTKTRTVFLSNLAEKYGNGISHNLAMFEGPSCNFKLSTSLILLRFDEKILTTDIRRAFLQLALNDHDKSKLLFLWFKNVSQNDFTVQAYANARLPFGLKPSPCILMVCLYKMLVLDSAENKRLADLKLLLYTLSYMDNIGVTSESTEQIIWAYDQLQPIFGAYKFELQKFCTNDPALQEHIVGYDAPQVVELFGIKWDTKNDTLMTKQKYLDPKADTKRNILRTIAQNYDPFNFEAPILNRARIFMHDLQCDKNLDWDSQITETGKQEWQKICKQVNGSETLVFPRFVGNRKDAYKLIAFSDSSKKIYGCILYLQNLESQKVSFLCAKNRIIGKNSESKSIPALEFAGILLGAEALVDMKQEISSEKCLVPINIVEMELYTDSMIALSWLNSYVNKLDKLNNLSTFVKNRLQKIERLCDKHPITFQFVDGTTNPADKVTREISSRLLRNSCYATGPDFLTSEIQEISRADTLVVKIPNPMHVCSQVTEAQVTPSSIEDRPGTSPAQTQLREAAVRPGGEDRCGEIPPPLIPWDRFSSSKKLIKCYNYVFKFINCLKSRLKQKNPVKYSHLNLYENISEFATNYVILSDQREQFTEVFEFFKHSNVPGKKIPNLILQLNLFIDKNNMLRVGSKISQNRKKDLKFCPFLLSKSSILSKLIIRDYHERLSHGGIYQILGELRKSFYVPSCFSAIKKSIKDCVICKRYNGRTIKNNQSSYHDFRLAPDTKPFSNTAIDYCGPFKVKCNDKTVKVYILVITCLYTRAINLQVSLDLTTKEFIRSFQLHVFKFGLPNFVLSDSGSQIIAGADVITSFLTDPETSQYLTECGSKMIQFQQYYPPKHEYGSLVEICVKLVKKLLLSSIKNYVLSMREFEFFVENTIHLVNRRPVALKETLRDSSSSADIPEIITPERLIHGFTLPAVNIIPSLQVDDLEEQSDPSFQPTTKIKNIDEKLKQVRARLISCYHAEFLPQLISQATDKASRYKPVYHEAIDIGDLVLLKEEHTKQSNFPLGRVKEITLNQNQEVTGAVIYKGSTGEVVKRHASAIIPLLKNTGIIEDQDHSASSVELSAPQRPSRRAAAKVSEDRTRNVLSR